LIDSGMQSFFDAIRGSSEDEPIDPKTLADMIEAEAIHLKSNPGHTRLIPPMLQVVAEFLNGKRDLKTGLAKRKPGGQKLTAGQRAAQTPTHLAAKFYFPAVMQVLREEYPEQTAADHRDHVKYIVNLMIGVEDPHGDTRVEVYRNKPKRGDHRI
jgi:hypothetical protein